MRTVWMIYRTRYGTTAAFAVLNETERAMVGSIAARERMTGGRSTHTLPPGGVEFRYVLTWDGVEPWQDFARRFARLSVSRKEIARAVGKPPATVTRLVAGDVVRKAAQRRYAGRDRDWHGARKLAAYRRAERAQP